MNTMEHERMRFTQMSQQQLLTRLKKITDPIKLENFIRLCKERGYILLENAARARVRELNERKNTQKIISHVFNTNAPSPFSSSSHGIILSEEANANIVTGNILGEPPKPKPIPQEKPIHSQDETGLGKRRLKL